MANDGGWYYGDGPMPEVGSIEIPAGIDEITIAGVGLTGATRVEIGGEEYEIVRPRWWQPIQLFRWWRSRDREMTVYKPTPRR